MKAAERALVDAAIAARAAAYAKYSGYTVGAALLDDRGNTHVGVNVENASYPLGTCAEAAAIAAMVAAGGTRIVTIAVAGGKGEPGACSPCGGCRQRIHEFANADTRVLMRADDGEWRAWTAAELLPASFRL